MQNFEKCLAVTLRFEGGYTDNPFDPGGATNLGITRATLAQFRGHAVSKLDVRTLGHDEAAKIYSEHYWRPLNADDLPAGVDLCLFDFAVNSGLSRAIQAARLLSATTHEAAIGPATIQALRAEKAAHVIDCISRTRLNFLRQLRTFPVFGRGWTTRVEAVRATALNFSSISN